MKLVQPHCRLKLSKTDCAFIAAVLQPGETNPEALFNLLADPESRDRILDDELLFHALLDSPAYFRVSLDLYFYILVRHVLKEADISDRNVADYIAAVLARFSRSFPPTRLSKRREPFFYIVDFLEEIEKADARRRFYLITWLGNQTLVLTSVFPDHIEYRARFRAAPGLNYYESVGRAQFEAASRHVLAQEFALARIFSTLSESFGIVRNALHEMRERLLFLGEGNLPC